MMLDLEMVQDGEYFRANGILVCFVEDSKVFVQTVDGKTDCGAATKLNVDAVVKNCRKVVKKQAESKSLVQKEVIEALMSFEGQVLIIDTKYYPNTEDEDVDYDGWFKCYSGGDVIIKGLDCSISWVDTNAVDITELVAKFFNVSYNKEKGISKYDVSTFDMSSKLNRISFNHFGKMLFSENFTFEMEIDMD